MRQGAALALTIAFAADSGDAPLVATMCEAVRTSLRVECTPRPHPTKTSPTVALPTALPCATALRGFVYRRPMALLPYRWHGRWHDLSDIVNQNLET